MLSFRELIALLEETLSPGAPSISKEFTKLQQLSRECESFYTSNVEKIAAEENLVKLQAVEKDLNQFKSRFLELQYLQDIGPVTFWKLYNSIIDKVNMKKAAKLNEHEINLFQRLKA
jgi:hypothetical protein